MIPSPALRLNRCRSTAMIARLLYRTVMTIAGPWIERYLQRRLARGKECAARFEERKGVAGHRRPDGNLVWIHAASNGEAMSALPLVERLLKRDPNGHVLLTTGTVTSADLMAARLGDRAIHQFVPVDRPRWVKSFLSHWRPDAGIWIESEFWPALIWEMQAAGKPMALVNGRISEKTIARWRMLPGVAQDLVAKFDPCLAQSPTDVGHLQALGATEAACVGNLKLSAAPLPVSPAVLEAERELLRGRVIWLAASTHPGEEDLVVQAHEGLARRFSNLLTVIVPRHPHRGGDLAKQMRDRGLAVCRKSEGGGVTAETDIYLADTLGELGLYYRLAPVAFIGGSLVGGHGGHNPIEAAQLGCAPVHGPDMANFSAIAADLAKAGGAVEVASAEGLADQVAALLADRAACMSVAQAAGAVANNGAECVDRVMRKLEPILPRSIDSGVDDPLSKEAGT